MATASTESTFFRPYWGAHGEVRAENTVSGNTVYGNAYYGICSYLRSDRAIISDNVVYNNGDSGIAVRTSYYNEVFCNTVYDNGARGIYLNGSVYGKIYNNNFINNPLQVDAEWYIGDVFNLDLPTGGNYWSNFDTPGEGCSDVNNDGICDAPYYFTNGADYLPRKRQIVCGAPSDVTPPVTTAVLSGILGNNGWHISDVQVTLSAADEEGGSGVANTEYSFDGITWNSYSAPILITNEGATTVYFRSSDNAGNVETTKSIVMNIDKTPPVIVITGVTDGATYPFNAPPVPGYTVTDALSGVASSGAVTIPGPANTFCRSAYTYSVGASDNAGNTANNSATYSVVVTADGLIDLIRQMLASGQISNAGIANSLIAQARNGNFNAFINHVKAQSGKHIAPEAAALLMNAAACLAN